MGLIQRAVESAGIPTIGITLQKEVTRRVKPPRALYLRYPFGHPMGEAFAVRIAGAASTWPSWRGHVGSTGVLERSKGTGWIV